MVIANGHGNWELLSLRESCLSKSKLRNSEILFLHSSELAKLSKVREGYHRIKTYGMETFDRRVSNKDQQNLKESDIARL